MQEFTWSQIRDRVHKVNPGFADLVDEFSPDDSHTVFVAKYPFGSEILVNGEMFLPCSDGSLISFDSPEVSADLKEKIGYIKSTNPMMMVLKNSMELYIPVENRVIPYAMIREGNLMGVWGVLEYSKKDFMLYTSVSVWGMTAGSRSLFMLPKISEAGAFHKLQKKYGLNAEVPRNLNDQWTIFRDIANHPEFSQSWELEVMYFSRKWVESINDLAWHKFKSYVSDIAWKSSDYWRNQFCVELTFSRVQQQRKIKPSAYVSDVASHLMSVAMGALPCFSPVVSDDLAPASGLREIFENEYGSRYSPILMAPKSFDIFTDYETPVYYSFQHHTAMKLANKSSMRSSAAKDLYDVRSLLDKYLYDIKNSDLSVSDIALYEMAKDVEFTFCHYVANDEYSLASAAEVSQGDSAFQKAFSKCSVKKWPKKAPFLDGCVQICRRKKD